MKLDPLEMADLTGGRWDPRPPPQSFEAVSQDTRRLSGGELYVALSGPRFDGHDFVATAKRDGAAAAMVAETFHDHTIAGWPLLRVADTRQALRNLAAGLRAGWAARVVGVTGSVGKTTVKDMIAHLSGGADGKVCVARTYENWNNDIGLPLCLLNAPRHAAFGIFEIGTNHPGEILPLAQLLQPQIGVVTTVGPAHLEHFGTTSAIAREKSGLLQVLPTDGVAVLNRDHADFDVLRAAAPCRVVTVSMAPKTQADYRGCSVEYLSDGMLCLVFEDTAGNRRRLTAPVSGRHQAANLLLAAATARQLDVGWDAITAAAISFEMPTMRWQRLQRAGITIINDAYNANPMSMRAALETFAGETADAGRRWLVLGGMLEMGDHAGAAHRGIGQWLARQKWQGLITVGELAREIAAGARDAGFPADTIRECSHTMEAAILLRENVKPGDAVLLKGSRGLNLETLVNEMIR